MSSPPAVSAPEPPRVAVKICGLSTEAAGESALEAGADVLGLVHFARSPRHVDLDRAAALAARWRGRAGLVLLLVDPDDALACRARDLVAPDLLQLHGRETPERVSALRALTGLAVMKAVGIASPEDVAHALRYRAVADRLLLDAKPQPGTLPGGNGLRFDWRLVAGLDPGLGFMLSGGLTAENVGEALRCVRPCGVDVSSGVETAPGVKDPGRIAAFLRAVRAAERAEAA